MSGLRVQKKDHPSGIDRLAGCKCKRQFGSSGNEAQVGELVCHITDAKDRNGRNMDIDIGILRDRPAVGNYGALTKRLVGGRRMTD